MSEESISIEDNGKSEDKPLGKPLGGRPKKGYEKINVPEAFKMRLRGFSYGEIAKQFGVSAPSVREILGRLENILGDRSITRAFSDHKSEFLTSAELALVERLFDTKKLHKASINNLAYALRQVYEINRLEKGQSTANVAYADLTREIEETKRAIKELEE